VIYLDLTRAFVVSGSVRRRVPDAKKSIKARISENLQ
jgi:hypothetical protein